MRKKDLRKGLIILIVGGILLAMGAANLITAQTLPGSDDTAFSSTNEKVDVLIGFHQTPGPSEQALVRAHGGEIYREFTIVDVIAASMAPHSADALSRNPRVKYVEPDHLLYALDQVTVQSTSETTVESAPWGIERVFASETHPFSTWDTSTGSGMAVAILDSGITEHIDLKIAGGYNAFEEEGYEDVYGHGIHVAGTVAALDNDLVVKPDDNNKGVVGVSPNIDLYAVKVLDDDGVGPASVIVAGIEWAINKGIPVMNMSLGTRHHNQTLQDTCYKAYNKGHLLVAAAGNSGNRGGGGDNVIYPAKYDSVIAVAASDGDDNRATWSSTGPDVELIAPGVSVLSTWKDDTSRFDPQPFCVEVDGECYYYKYGSGTSMSSPHVAGAAALAWAANPGLDNVEIREILQDTTEDLGMDDNHQGYGLVRADLSVAEALDVEVADYEVAVVAPEGAEETETGSYTYIFEIKNTGTEDDIYDLAVGSDGDNFTAVVEEKIAVEEDKTEEVDVEVEITEDAEAGDSATITLTAESQDSDVSDSDSMVVTLIGEPEVETLGASVVTESRAILEGELTDLGGADSVEVWFEWADNENLEGAQETDRQTLEETGTYENTLDGLEPETTYYFKAVAENEAGIDKGEVVDFTTQEEKELAEPEIITFEIDTRTTGPWNWADVEWEVYQDDGALNKVISELLVLDNDGKVVEVLDKETTSVSGESASGEHNLRTRRDDANAVRLTVTDTEEQNTTETKDAVW